MTNWTAQVNDLVGGWIVTTYPHPLSAHDHRPDGDPTKRGAIIADCSTEADAKLIADLLNGHNRAESSRRDWAAEAEWRRREAEFEALGERWEGCIVAREGHEWVNGGNRCACGTPCSSLRDWSDHLLASRMIEGMPLCACVTDEQAAQLDPRFSRPVCAVHRASGGA